MSAFNQVKINREQQHYDQLHLSVKSIPGVEKMVFLKQSSILSLTKFATVFVFRFGLNRNLDPKCKVEPIERFYLNRIALLIQPLHCLHSLWIHSLRLGLISF